MDSSRSSLLNVDRANSTLFKRYLDEQHKSVDKSNIYQPLSRPINSTIQITHTIRQQNTFTTTELNASNNNHNQQLIVKRKYSHGRRPAADTSKQRTSHTSRFMKRFQRQYKNGETLTNVQKRDGKPRFEFHEPPTRTDQQGFQCKCLTLSGQNRGEHHHRQCPAKQSQLPRLSLNELFHSTSRQRPVGSSSPPPKLMLPPVTNESIRSESISNVTHLVEQNPLASLSSTVVPPTTRDSVSEVFSLDHPPVNLSNEYWPMINDLLQELSLEMTGKPSVDMLLEIEESLAQRIYNCIVEHNDENDSESQSHSPITNDSSALSAPPPPLALNNKLSYEPNDLPPSPISTTTREPINNRQTYFQPIREQPSPPPPSFTNFLDRNRHSTPFNRISKDLEHDTRSPFAQSLFEPVHLLRTVATDDHDDFHFFPPSFSFAGQQHSNTDLNFFQQSKSELPITSYPPSVPFRNHLLPPRTTPVDTSKLSAFKPIEPAQLRSTTSFALKRPHVSSSSTGTTWFGQS